MRYAQFALTLGRALLLLVYNGTGDEGALKMVKKSEIAKIGDDEVAEHARTYLGELLSRRGVNRRVADDLAHEIIATAELKVFEAIRPLQAGLKIGAA